MQPGLPTYISAGSLPKNQRTLSHCLSTKMRDSLDHLSKPSLALSFLLINLSTLHCCLSVIHFSESEASGLEVSNHPENPGIFVSSIPQPYAPWSYSVNSQGDARTNIYLSPDGQYATTTYESTKVQFGDPMSLLSFLSSFFF